MFIIFKTNNDYMKIFAIISFCLISFIGFGQDYEYRVQIGAFAFPKAVNDFPHAEQLTSITMSNGVTKYFSGSFATYQEAKAHKQQMIDAGYTESFLIVFENDQIVPVSVWKKHIPELAESEDFTTQEAPIDNPSPVKNDQLAEDDSKTGQDNPTNEKVDPMSVAKNIDYDPKKGHLPLNTVANKSDLELSGKEEIEPEDLLQMKPEDVAELMSYRVYIGTHGENIDEEFKTRMNLLTNLIYYYPTEDQTFIYTSGSFETLAEAQVFEQEVRDIGFKNIRIVAVAKRVVFNIQPDGLPINQTPISAVPKKKITKHLHEVVNDTIPSN